MRGLGDNIYIKAFVQTLSKENEIHIATPWPELFQDIPGIKFQKPYTTLRTQLKNIVRVPSGVWSYETRFDKTINVQYGAGKNIADDLRRIFECDPTWGLPKFKGPEIGKPYIVIRPATLRKEWFAGSRNPKPEYLNDVSEWLREKYHIVSVADFENGQEWADGDLPYADQIFHKGELHVSDLLGLCQGAAGIVGGIGWIVPFAVSSGVPAFIVAGGCGEYNAPWKVTNKSMDLTKIKFAVPDKFCTCRDMKHGCNKDISNLKWVFDDWMEKGMRS